MGSDGPIVVWVDATEESTAAVEFAIEQAQLRSVSIVLVSTISRPSLVLMEALQIDTGPVLRTLREQVSERWSRLVTDASVVCQEVVERGDEAETLSEVAKDRHASMVVVGVGTHVSSRLVHHWSQTLPCPSVLVPHP